MTADNATSVRSEKGEDGVYSECPLCSWESAIWPLHSIPNAEWNARQEAAREYRSHFDYEHRPLPRFVRMMHKSVN